MRHFAILLALLVPVVLTGCVSGLNTAAERDLDRAAQSLDAQLGAPGLLAATTLLFHETNERYPTSPFDLLGSAAARETGLQTLGLSALAMEADGEGVVLSYTLLPTPGDPSERFGQLMIAETDTAGTYDVGLVLERIADPDLASRSLPLAQEGSYAVVRAKGTLCATVAEVRERIRSGASVGDPPLGEGRAYKVTFTAARGAASELGEGYTVTLPR